MLKSLTSFGRYLNVIGGTPMSYYGGGSGYYGGHGGGMGTGNMRFNGTTQNVEMYDGSNWVVVNSSNATITLTPEAEELLDWAKRKRDEEKELEILAKNYPTIADLVSELKAVQEKIAVVQTLVREEKKIV